jgi:homoserine dehydrogenase
MLRFRNSGEHERDCDASLQPRVKVMKRNVGIGLIGFGTIGSGVYNLIEKNRDIITERTGIALTVKKICDVRIDVVKKAAPDVMIIDTWQDMIADPDIETIVELIGGIKPAQEIILKALTAGKNVVTANKKLLAEAGFEILEKASRGVAKLNFEAAVGGGIPCVAALKHGLVGNRIRSVMGILNGTTNYILTRMAEDELSFEAALGEAQAKGFAEADPTFDVEGFDAGHKITLLAMLAFNKRIGFDVVAKEGITKVSSVDIEFAREMGYVIKLLGIAKDIGDRLDVRVHPTMIRKEHLLASVRLENNAVMFDGDMTGPVIMYGKGAGALPTASAVVSDIIDIAQKKDIEQGAMHIDRVAEMLPTSDRISRYYLRMMTNDRTGILTKISGVLASNGISIASVVQKEGDGSGFVPLIITTHLAAETGIMRSIEEINGCDFMKDRTVLLRIEDSAEGCNG